MTTVYLRSINADKLPKTPKLRARLDPHRWPSETLADEFASLQSYRSVTHTPSSRNQRYLFLKLLIKMLVDAKFDDDIATLVNVLNNAVLFPHISSSISQPLKVTSRRLRAAASDFYVTPENTDDEELMTFLRRRICDDPSVFETVLGSLYPGIPVYFARTYLPDDVSRRQAFYKEEIEKSMHQGVQGPMNRIVDNMIRFYLLREDAEVIEVPKHMIMTWKPVFEEYDSIEDDYTMDFMDAPPSTLPPLSPSETDLGDVCETLSRARNSNEQAAALRIIVSHTQTLLARVNSYTQLNRKQIVLATLLDGYNTKMTVPDSIDHYQEADPAGEGDSDWSVTEDESSDEYGGDTAISPKKARR